MVQLRANELGAVLLALAERLVSFGRVSTNRKHQRHRLLGSGDAIGRWGVHHHDPTLCGRPNVHIVDPYSKRYVNEIRYDTYGRAYRVTGWRWTSFGRPHSELTSTWLHPSGGRIGTQQSVTQFKNSGKVRGNQSVTRHYSGRR